MEQNLKRIELSIEYSDKEDLKLNLNYLLKELDSRIKLNDSLLEFKIEIINEQKCIIKQSKMNNYE